LLEKLSLINSEGKLLKRESNKLAVYFIAIKLNFISFKETNFYTVSESVSTLFKIGSLRA
jgi:hypothetical protein